MISDQHAFVLVTISGTDKPGITASLTKIIANSNYPICDMGQSVTHGFLSLSILIDFGSSQEQQDSALLKDLLFEAKKLGLILEFKILDAKYQNRQVAEKFIVSAVSPTSISAGFISDLSAALSKFNLNIQRITNQTPNSSLKSLDIYISSDKDIDDIELKSTVMTLSQKHRVDLAVIKDNVFRYNKRLIVFDMDSTLIQSEVIDELAVLHGVSDQVKEITHKAMNGEIDFNQSLGKRVGLLKGLKKEKALSLMDQIKMTPGTETFLKVVKSLGYKTAVISGGFTLFTEYLRQKYSFDYAFANELEIKDDTLTGNVIPPIVNGEHKAFLLNLISQQESISLEQVVAIGDGANDLPMLSRAGMGIAFHAKEIVKKNAEHNMSFGPMTSILNLLGIPHDYFQQFL